MTFLSPAVQGIPPPQRARSAHGMASPMAPGRRPWAGGPSGCRGMSRFPDEPPPPEPPRPSPPEEERAILPSRGRLALDEGPPVRLKAPRSSSPMPATRLPGRRFADHSGGGSERRTAAARPADVPVRPPSPGRGLRQPASPGSPAAFPLDDDANDAGLGAFLAYSGRCQGKAEPCAPQAASRSVAGAHPGGLCTPT